MYVRLRQAGQVAESGLVDTSMNRRKFLACLTVPLAIPAIRRAGQWITDDTYIVVNNPITLTLPPVLDSKPIKIQNRSTESITINGSPQGAITMAGKHELTQYPDGRVWILPILDA